MALALALLLLVIAITAQVRLRPHQLPAGKLIWWWAPSLMGQTLAAPLALVAGIVVLAAEAPAARVTAALAAIVFVLIHARNRRDGEALMKLAGLNQRLPMSAGLWPVNNRAGTTRQRDIAYGLEGEANKLDVLAPAVRPAEAMPVLIHLPGGGWIWGRRDQQAKPLLHHMARQGWLCLDISYRLGPKHRFPAMLTDVLRAIAWAKANVAEHGGNPARIAVTGGSAGGHLTALAALRHDHAAAKPGFETIDCRVSAAVPCYGRYDFIDRLALMGRNHERIRRYHAENVMPDDADPAAWDLASPIAGTRGDAPPLLVIHGRHDTLLPNEEASAFVAAQRRAGGQVDHVELAGGQHAYDWWPSATTAGHVRAIHAWLMQKV